MKYLEALEGATITTLLTIMPKSSSLQSSGGLSPGNVVSAGLRIYRDRFRVYYGLALKAYLWVIIPIYGWAKFSALSALISRLAFREVIERPETVQEAHERVERKMWDFLLAGFLLSMMTSGIAIVCFLIISIFLIVAIFLLANILPSRTLLIVIGTILVIAGIIALFFLYFWFYARFFILEIPLAIEIGVDGTSTFGRSWQLTKGSVLRLQLILFVATLISFPAIILSQTISYIPQIILAFIPEDSLSILGSLLFFLLFLLILALTFGMAALFLPFWQSIKAVVYYDLCSRREGLDFLISQINRE